MKVAVITHYFPPEIGAPQARLFEMARTWASDGHVVSVVTCFPNHPTGVVSPEYKRIYKKKKYMEEVIEGIFITRCWVYATPNKGFAKKIAGHLSFMISAVVQGHGRIKGNDLIVVSSPTFFSVISAWILSKWYRIPYIFEVRDLWPAIFVELGILKSRPMIKSLEILELFLYRQSRMIVPVTKAFAANISGRGIDPAKIRVIYNGADLAQFSPLEKDPAIVAEYNLGGKFVVMYLGAHGISHALNRIVEAAALLSSHQDIIFIFVGEGAEKENLIALARQMQLKNVIFIEGQRKQMVARWYSIMDIGLVPLRDIPLFDTFIPSKMFEIMAMRRPIVASVRGEAREILQASGAAIVCPPENIKAIAESVLELYHNGSKRLEMGEKGRKFVEKEFDRAALARRYLSVMQAAVGPPKK